MRGPEQLGPYTLCQPEGVFPLGEDALALGGFATVKRGWRVCDLGPGSGCLLLLLAGREEELRLSGVDRDPAAAQAARDNLARNGLSGEIWTGDWGAVPFAPGSFDLVISNPPYYARGSGGDGGPAAVGESPIPSAPILSATATAAIGSPPPIPRLAVRGGAGPRRWPPPHNRASPETGCADIGLRNGWLPESAASALGPFPGGRRFRAS